MKNSNGKIIFFMALLTMYALVTGAAAFLFEYYTVSTSEGELIFSFAMSWQLLLFIFELITIIIQLVTLILIFKKGTQKRYRILFVAGMCAVGAAALVTVYTIIADGFKPYPAGIYLTYTLLIFVVRGIVIPKCIRKNYV